MCEFVEQLNATAQIENDCLNWSDITRCLKHGRQRFLHSTVPFQVFLFPRTPRGRLIRAFHDYDWDTSRFRLLLTRNSNCPSFIILLRHSLIPIQIARSRMYPSVTLRLTMVILRRDSRVTRKLSETKIFFNSHLSPPLVDGAFFSVQ